jgi:hypothetical protein
MRTAQSLTRLEVNDSSSKPTPMELIRFCKEVGIDLFTRNLKKRIARLKTSADYSVLVKDLLNHSAQADSVQDKLRLALNWWTDISHAAAAVIQEARTPKEFVGDARLNFRWHRSRRSGKIPIPQSIIHDAELQWEIACSEGEQISVQAALNQTRFKTEGGMQQALREFGCPSKLTGSLTLYAVKQLRRLDKKWVKAQNKKRSAKRRSSKSQKKK